MDDKCVLMDILDTAGQEEYSLLYDQWHREAQVLVIVYSVTNTTTFEEAKIHRGKIEESRRDEYPDGFPIVLVGNKCDLEDQRKVSTEEGVDLVGEWGPNAVFMETSAKQKINIDDLFQTAVRTLLAANDRRSNETAKELKRSLPIPNVSLSCKCCDCSCFSLSDWYHALRYETVKEESNMEKDKIKFHRNDKPPRPDIIPAPIYSLKNFRVKRIFNWTRFIVAIICGAFLPIIIILQTIAFLMYSEFKEATYYPKFYAYEDIHASIFYDFLGIVIGRKPGQDPETVKDRKWFLRQTRLQKLKRVLATFIITLISLICFYNITQVNNKKLKVSMMETIGPFLLFWIVWLLLSLWIAYEIKLDPKLPSPLRLRYVL